MIEKGTALLKGMKSLVIMNKSCNVLVRSERGSSRGTQRCLSMEISRKLTLVENNKMATIVELDVNSSNQHCVYFNPASSPSPLIEFRTMTQICFAYDVSTQVSTAIQVTGVRRFVCREMMYRQFASSEGL